MYVGPADFRSIRRDGLVLRFAILGQVAYVLAEVPATGSGGTALEEPCERPHWAFVFGGGLDLDVTHVPVTVPPGNAVHVAEGVAPPMRAPRRTPPARVQPLDARQD